MPRNKMSDLRNHLFETLERLKDEDNPMDVQRALAVSDVASTLIDSVKTEIRFMEASGEVVDAEFFDARATLPAPERGLQPSPRRAAHRTA